MATVYLSPSGNDANTYVQAQNPATPWATPGKVQTSAVTGDTVIMAAGTYALAGVTWTKSFTFNGAALLNGMPTTILDGAGATFVPNTLWAVNATGIVLSVSNVRFTNATLAGGLVIGFYSGGPACSVVLTNCVFDTFSFTSGNVGIVGSVNGNVSFTLTNCLMYNISSNAVYGNLGMIVEWIQATSGSLTLNGCSFHNKSGSNISSILIGTNAPPLTVKDCIFYSANSAQLVTAGFGTTTYSYSDAYNCTSIPGGIGNITTDPLFVDTANGNFNLRPTSPCLGTGSL